MARWGFAATATLLTALTLGISGCGVAGGQRTVGDAPVAEPVAQVALDAADALGVDADSLVTLGLDPAEFDALAAPGSVPASAEQGDQRGRERPRGERGKQWDRGLLRRGTLHGELVMRTRDGIRTVVVQRGEVTSVDSTTISVKSVDGYTLTWTFGPKLRVIERRATVQPSAVRPGVIVAVAGVKEGDTTVARLILISTGK